MEWDFTPEDVRSGNVDYSVAEFREDLIEVLRMESSKKAGYRLPEGSIQ
jgi:hypothetical protein